MLQINKHLPKNLMIVHILSAEKGMRIFWGISSYKYLSQLFNKVSIQGKNADGMKGAREYGELKVQNTIEKNKHS